jgi:hypothetical protein
MSTARSTDALLGSDLGDFSASTEIGPNDYLKNLKFGAMATGEVRKGDWSVFTDIIYIDFGDQRSRVRNITGLEGRSLSSIDRNATTSLSATVWTLAGARTLVNKAHGQPRSVGRVPLRGIATELKLNIIGSDGVSTPALTKLPRPDRVGRHHRGQGPGPAR